MKVRGNVGRRLATSMLAGLVFATAATPASADLYTINFSDVGLGISNYFILDSAQPIGYNSGSAIFYNVDGGVAANFYNTAYYQANSGIPYSFGYADGTVNAFYSGQALYSGSEASPTFNTGPFTLTREDGSAETASISIAAVPAGPGAPAPEVGAGLLSALAAGLALIFTRRRGRPSVAVA